MQKSSNRVFNDMLNSQRNLGQMSVYDQTQQATGNGGYGYTPDSGTVYNPYNSNQNSKFKSITIDSIVTKTAISLGLLTLVTIFSYFLVGNNINLALPLTLLGGLGSFAIVMWTSFKRTYGAVSTLSYAVLEGLALGSISYIFAQYTNIGSGIIMQAVMATICVVAAMLIVYRTGVIRVTPRFTKIILSVLMAAVLLTLVNIVVSFFHPGGLGIRGAGTTGIVFSIIMIVIGAFSLLIDFDNADSLVRAEAPEEMSWGVSLGLMVTIVWVYTEILRLLAVLNSSNN